MREDAVDVIILAGGLGTRLRSVVSNYPKVLAPVGDRPFLDLLLHGLAQASVIRKVILAVGYKSRYVLDLYKGRLIGAAPIVFSAEHAPLGTGGAIKKALECTETPDVVVMNGDSFLEIDHEVFVEFHHEEVADMTVALHPVTDVGRFGAVLIDRDSRIRGFSEKPMSQRPGLINGGVYVLQREMFDDVPENFSCSLERDLFPKFVDRRVFGFRTRGRFIDIGVPETYEQAEAYLADLVAEGHPAARCGEASDGVRSLEGTPKGLTP